MLSVRIKYLIIALLSFLSILFANISLVFKPLYTQVYYGQSDPIFYYGISSVLLIIAFLILKLVIMRKLDVKYEKLNRQLPIKKLLIVYFLTILIIFGISYYIEWNVKPFYDMGVNFTGFQLLIHAIKLIYCAIVMMFVVLMIENLQYGLEGLIPFNNPKIHKYLPVGGLATMLTFGFYQAFTSLTTLPLLYFFLILVYGVIYLLVERSFIKAYFSILFIFLF